MPAKVKQQLEPYSRALGALDAPRTLSERDRGALEKCVMFVVGVRSLLVDDDGRWIDNLDGAMFIEELSGMLESLGLGGN